MRPATAADQEWLREWDYVVPSRKETLRALKRGDIVPTPFVRRGDHYAALRMLRSVDLATAL